MSGVRALSYVPNVIISVTEKFTQDIDCHDPQTAVCLNLKNGKDSLI
jgi:hypothetical protein